MLTAVLCVLLCLCTIAAICRAFASNKHELPPAYPGALPLIGHSYLILGLADSSKIWEFLKFAAEDAVKKGGVTYMAIANQIYYVIVNAEDALTASNACTRKPFAYDLGKSWLGEGLLTASGEIWKRHRKIMHPAFGASVIHGFLKIFNDQAKKLLIEVAPQVGRGPFDILDHFRRNALETFSLSAFGMDVDEDDNLIQRYMDAVDIGLDMIVSRFQTFWQHSDFLFWLSGLKKKEQAEVEKFTNMSNKILQRKKAEMKNAVLNDSKDLENADDKCKSFLDHLLELSADGTLTDKEIREEIDTIIAAGFETTSNQMLYILLLLGANTEVQDKLHEEISNVLGPIDDVHKEDLSKLVYTNAVIMESFRICPSVPVVLRLVENDVKLKNFTMHAGSQCALAPFINKHDPIWGPAGDKFRPERWLEHPDLSGKKEFAGFGLGKRRCIGRQYAMVTMKVLLAHFIREYRVTADIRQLKHKFDFVLKPAAGHEIEIQRRF